MADPNTPDEWLTLARQHEAGARAMVEDRNAAGLACFHAGIAVECALKACIMRRERLNGWPSFAARPELYTHDLRRLSMIAGMVVERKDGSAPAWSLFLQWDRGQAYNPKPMPRKVARGWVEAAFGKSGIVAWISRNCP